MDFDQRKIGPLDVMEIKGEANGPAIILLHGYGANAGDLFSLNQYIETQPGTSWYFPEGRLELGQTPMFVSRAWFEIDHEALQMAQMAGTHRDLANTIPEEMAASRQAVEEMLEAILAEGKHKPENIMLGGFSQGAMLSVEVALHAKQNLAGLILMSGNLLNSESWKNAAPARKGLRFFQSHGTNDPLLGFPGAKALYNLLTESGLEGEFHEFVGGHEIPAMVLEKLNAFLK